MSTTEEPTSGPLGSWLRPPRWVVGAIVLFWIGYVVTITSVDLFHRIGDLVVLLVISLFLSFAIEPAVNTLAARGWRRGAATLSILLGVLLATAVFVGAIGTLVGQQVAELLGNLEDYVTRSVDFLNDNVGTDIVAADVIASINDPDGPVQQFIRNQSDRALALSITVLGLLLQTLSVLLFTFYLVADGPRLRRVILTRLDPEQQRRVLATWELAVDKTGGYLYSRALLAGISSAFHWVAFEFLDTPAPVALAMWVGLVSQFLPVIGTYLAGILPVFITLLDTPITALWVGVAIVVYQQLENYLLGPRVTARTMALHPALSFGAALAGAAMMGVVGAVLALPAVAMAQGLISAAGRRYEVVDSPLTAAPPPAGASPRRRRRRGPGAAAPDTGTGE